MFSSLPLCFVAVYVYLFDFNCDFFLRLIPSAFGDIFFPFVLLNQKSSKKVLNCVLKQFSVVNVLLKLISELFFF